MFPKPVSAQWLIVKLKTELISRSSLRAVPGFLSMPESIPPPASSALGLLLSFKGAAIPRPLIGSIPRFL